MPTLVVMGRYTGIEGGGIWRTDTKNHRVAPAHVRNHKRRLEQGDVSKQHYNTLLLKGAD
jgi:hypothetical protein